MKKLIGIVLLLAGATFVSLTYVVIRPDFYTRILYVVLGFIPMGIGLQIFKTNSFNLLAMSEKETKKEAPKEETLREFKEEDSDRYKPK